MAKKTPFILHVELPKALEFILAARAKRRAEMEAKGDTKDRWYARECYITATDLEYRVRAAAAEVIDGKKYGENGELGTFSMQPFKFQGLNGQSLLDHCRDFLLRDCPQLLRHNFGRGHISGMRFRTKDMPLSDSEESTFANKEKVKPVHFRFRKTERSMAEPLCVSTRKPPARGYTFRSPKPSSASMTTEEAKVNCPRCLNMLAEQKKSQAETVNA